jgi:hypothetical protein
LNRLKPVVVNGKSKRKTRPRASRLPVRHRADDLFHLKRKKKGKGKGKGKYNKVTFLMTATLEALRSRRLTLIPQSFPRFTPRHAYFFQLFSDEIHLFFFPMLSSSRVNLLFLFSRTIFVVKSFSTYNRLIFFLRYFFFGTIYNYAMSITSRDIILIRLWTIYLY